jgi:hypothetical protein
VYRGEAFCVVEEKLVLFGRLAGYTPENEKEPSKGELLRVLERKAPPPLSAGMQAGLKTAPLTNSGVIVLDFANWPDRQKQGFLGELGLQALKDHSDKLETLSLTINETDKVTAKVVVSCKDEAAARAVKKHTDDRLAALQDAIAKRPKEATDPKAKDFEPIVKSTGDVLGAVKTSVNGTQVIAEASAVPASAVRFLFGYFHLANEERAKKPFDK